MDSYPLPARFEQKFFTTFPLQVPPPFLEPAFETTMQPDVPKICVLPPF